MGCMNNHGNSSSISSCSSSKNGEQLAAVNTDQRSRESAAAWISAADDRSLCRKTTGSDWEISQCWAEGSCCVSVKGKVIVFAIAGCSCDNGLLALWIAVTGGRDRRVPGMCKLQVGGGQLNPRNAMLLWNPTLQLSAGRADTASS